MAQVARRLSENVPGKFFVDASCIDCDACRQIAPATFHDHGGQSSVHAQPRTAATTRRALMALVACPTASISTTSRLSARMAAQAFPDPIVDNVYFCVRAHATARPDPDGGPTRLAYDVDLETATPSNTSYRPLSKKEE